MVSELSNAVVVAFPLRGEGWVAVSSPADPIPSHGTNILGQRFAYDFLMTDQRARAHYHPAGWLRTFLIGVPTRECFAWGAPVHSPIDGLIVRAVDGCAERSRIHPVREAFLALKNALTFAPARLPSILGNHVIVQGADVVAAFVHLAPGSVAVREGQRVRVGDVIGRVGHTGNYTEGARLLFEGSPMIEGRAAIEALLAPGLRKRPTTISFESIDVLDGGSFVVDVGRFTTPTGKGKYVVVHERQPDGSLKMAIDSATGDGAE